MFWSFTPILLHRNFKGGMTTVTLLESSFRTFYNNYTKNFKKCQLFNSSNFLNHKTQLYPTAGLEPANYSFTENCLNHFDYTGSMNCCVCLIGCGGGIRTHARLSLTESKSVALPLGDSTINWWGEGGESNSQLQNHNLP